MEKEKIEKMIDEELQQRISAYNEVKLLFKEVYSKLEGRDEIEKFIKKIDEYFERAKEMKAKALIYRLVKFYMDMIRNYLDYMKWKITAEEFWKKYWEELDKLYLFIFLFF